MAEGRTERVKYCTRESKYKTSEGEKRSGYTALLEEDNAICKIKKKRTSHFCLKLTQKWTQTTKWRSGGVAVLMLIPDTSKYPCWPNEFSPQIPSQLQLTVIVGSCYKHPKLKFSNKCSSNNITEFLCCTTIKIMLSLNPSLVSQKLKHKNIWCRYKYINHLEKMKFELCPEASLVQ